MQTVLSVNNMRQADKETIESGIKSSYLMYNAAFNVYKNVNWYGSIAIFCGSGNNGGDGYCLANILNENNYDVTIVLCSDKFSDDGFYYYNLCLKNNIKLIKFNEIKDKYDIAVDALLGTGFKGKLSEELNNIINYINNHFNYVISIDINSGLNGDNGMCDNAIVSNKTISIGYLKPGLFLNKAKDYIKELINGEIGIKNSKKSYYLLEEKDVKKIIKPRINDCNKGDFGTVAIMGGSKNYPGAVRLANLGQTCLYSGCGISRLIVPSCIYDLIFSNVLETILYSIPSKNGKMIFSEEDINNSLKNVKALGFGVGLDKSEEHEKILDYIIKNFNFPIVIDADGINTLANMDLSILKDNIILTPHLKEFSRLTNKPIQDIKEHLIEYGEDFVRKYNCTLLLKGPSTLVFDKNKTIIVNKGSKGMATAGSGDVLLGILTGLLGRSECSLVETSAIAAYLNGEAGEEAEKEFGDISMVASSTLSCLSKVIKRIE